MKPLYPCNVDSIPLLFKNGLEPFELHFNNINDLKTTFQNVEAIHFPNSIEKGKLISLVDENESKLFKETLRNVVLYSKKNNIRKIILHTPNINLFDFDKSDAISNFIRILEDVYDPNVRFCIENSCLWINNVYTHNPLFTESLDFFEILNQTKIPLNVTLDIEHLYMTFLMTKLLSKNKTLFNKQENSEIVSQFENDLNFFLKDNNFVNEADKFVMQNIEDLKDYIYHFHICGSDYKNYFFNPKTGLPLIGEHLPTGFEGKIYNKNVKDRLNHKLIFNQIKNLNTDFTIETYPKGGYNVIDAFKRSRDYIHDLGFI